MSRLSIRFPNSVIPYVLNWHIVCPSTHAPPLTQLQSKPFRVRLGECPQTTVHLMKPTISVCNLHVVSEFRSAASNLIFIFKWTDKKKTHSQPIMRIYALAEKGSLSYCWFYCYFNFQPADKFTSCNVHRTHTELNKNNEKKKKNIKYARSNKIEEHMINISSWAYQAFGGFASTEIHAFDKIKRSKFEEVAGQEQHLCIII